MNNKHKTSWKQRSLASRIEAYIASEVGERAALCCPFLLHRPTTEQDSGYDRDDDGDSNSILERDDRPRDHDHVNNISGSLPVFRRNEIQTRQVLGHGAFSEVHQISSFRLSTPNTHQADYGGDDEDDEAEHDHDHDHDRHNKIQYHLDQRRKNLQANIVDGTGKYVLKHLRKDLSTHARHSKTVLQAAADLVMEANYLARFRHPNIISIRGCASGPSSFVQDGMDGFFLILDKLDETLSQRIERWKIQEDWRFMDVQQFQATPVVDLETKLDYGLQIAQALDYLHDRRLIFRDLKPDNIGFQGHTVKLFDFGLIRQLPGICNNGNDDNNHDNHDNRDSDDDCDDEVFCMSGVGTRRYMAPEVVNRQGYNRKADVYSWTMVFHSMLSLEKPFDGYTPALHELLVCQEGVRPTLEPEWPSDIHELCQRGWAQCHRDRPTIKQMCKTITELMDRLKLNQ